MSTPTREVEPRVDRPLGIAIISVLIVLQGLYAVILGLIGGGMAAFGFMPFLAGMGFLAALIGLVYIMLGVALWRGRSWAWKVIVALQVIGVIASLFLALMGAVGMGLFFLLFNLIILWYLNRPHVRRFFRL